MHCRMPIKLKIYRKLGGRTFRILDAFTVILKNSSATLLVHFEHHEYIHISIYIYIKIESDSNLHT